MRLKRCLVCGKERSENVSMCCNQTRFGPLYDPEFEESPVVEEPVAEEELVEEELFEEHQEPDPEPEIIEEEEFDAEELLRAVVDQIDLDELEVVYPSYINEIPIKEVREFAQKHFEETESLKAKIKKYLGL